MFGDIIRSIAALLIATYVVTTILVVVGILIVEYS